MNMSWGFLQIVAVTIWVPTVAGFINMYVDGVSSAHRKQLPAAYWTVETKLKQDDRLIIVQDSSESPQEETPNDDVYSFSQQIA